MILVNEEQKQTYREAANISIGILYEVSKNLKEGVLPIEIDKQAYELCKQYKVKPAFFNVKANAKNKFGHNICVGVNDEVLHSIPSSQRKLQYGDIVKLDFGIIYKGFYTDQCYTFVIGGYKNKQDQKLVEVAKSSIENAVYKARSGMKILDLTELIFNPVQDAGFTTMKDFVGHSIGRTLWDSPAIPSYYPFIVENKKEKLQPNQVICIESQVVAGSNEYFLEEGWTVKTKDGSNGAMYEYMLMLGEDEDNEVLTDMFNWDVVVGAS